MAWLIFLTVFPSNNMAIVHSALGDQRKAIKYLEKAIAIITRELGERHFKIGIYSANLADAHLQCSEQEEAVALYHKSLDVLDETLGKNHIEVADVLIKIGTYLQSSGQYRDAFFKLSRAQGIVKATLGVGHPKFKQCDKALEEIEMRDPSLVRDQAK